MPEQESPEEVLIRILETFRRAYQEAAASLGAIPDPEEAFDAVDEFDTRLRGLHNEQVPLLRALQIVRSRERKPGSLADLAKRHNRSKARIAQYVRIAEAAAKEEPCSSST
jgi:hypothetical protein